MGAVLALSMLGAKAFTDRHAAPLAAVNFGEMDVVSVGDLRLPVPAGWRRRDDPQHETCVHFTDPNSDARMLAAELTFDAPLHPYDALNLSLNTFALLGSNQQLEVAAPPEAFRAGVFAGLRITGVTQRSGQPMAHHVAILTENARRFWVIHMRQSRIGAMVEGHHLLSHISENAEDLGRTDVTTDQLTAAGLQWTNPHAGPLLRTGTDGGIDVVWTDSERPCVARIAASIAPPEGSSDEMTLLSASFESRVGRAPHDHEREAYELDSGPRVCVVHHQAKTFDGEDGLAWAEVFINYGDGRAAVAELIGGDERAHIQQLARALTPLWQSEAMLENGERLSRTLRQLTAERSEPAAMFYELRRSGEPVGFAMERMEAGNEPFEWEGNAVIVRRSSLIGPSVINWKYEVDDQRYTYMHLRREVGDEQPSGYRLQSDGDTLTLRRVATDGSEQIEWIADVPPRFVAPLSTTWWPQQIAPAVVMYGLGERKPEPYIIRRIDGESPIIVMRRLASPVGDRMTVDATGEVVEHAYVTQQPPGQPARNVTLVTVDRARLIEKYPNMREQIEKW